MKVLTLQQPWATLVAIGAKKIETRSWSTKYRGMLAIHSGKKFQASQFKICYTEPFYTVLTENGIHANNLILGKIIATCKLVDILQITKEFQSNLGLMEPKEFCFGDYAPDRFAWIIEDVKMLDNPIPAKGMLGLWESPRCHCDGDGDCDWEECPQKIDYKSICPFYELQSREYEEE